jgi:hypothetical protein
MQGVALALATLANSYDLHETNPFVRMGQASPTIWTPFVLDSLIRIIVPINDATRQDILNSDAWRLEILPSLATAPDDEDIEERRVAYVWEWLELHDLRVPINIDHAKYKQTLMGDPASLGDHLGVIFNSPTFLANPKPFMPDAIGISDNEWLDFVRYLITPPPLP